MTETSDEVLFSYQKNSNCDDENQSSRPNHVAHSQSKTSSDRVAKPSPHNKSIVQFQQSKAFKLSKGENKEQPQNQKQSVLSPSSQHHIDLINSLSSLSLSGQSINKLPSTQHPSPTMRNKDDVLDCSRAEINGMKSRLKDDDVFYVKSDPVTSEQLTDLMHPYTLLSSDHINAYFSMLNQRHRSIYGLSTYFYTRLVSTIAGYEYKAVTRWTKHTRIFEKELVFVPINLGQVHWILAVIWMKRRRIEIWDSMGNAQHKDTVGKTLNRYLKDEYIYKESIDATDLSSNTIDDEEEEEEDDDGNASHISGRTNNTYASHISVASNQTNISIHSNTTQSTHVSSAHSAKAGQEEGEEEEEEEEDDDDDVEWKDFKVVDKFVQEHGPQKDGTSCGVFVCLTARLLADGKSEECLRDTIFRHNAADDYRKKMALEIFQFATRNEANT